MASVRNIPNGFNANYEIVTKIIGSKYVRCLVEKNEGTKQSVKAETQSMLSPQFPCNARQTHGNPPGLHKLPCQQISYRLSDEQQSKGEMGEYKSKQAEATESRSVSNLGLRPLNTYCVTAPCGDKSLSYIHTLQQPSIGPQTLRQQEGQPDTAKKYEENDSLLTLLKKELEATPLSAMTLNKLQEECKVLDPRLSGFLSQANLSHLLLKYEIPLQLPTVNYEQLFQNLKLVAACILPPRPALLQKSQNLKNWSKSSWTTENAFQALTQILKQHKEELDFGQLSLSFLQQDSTCSGLLSFPEVEMICQKHGLPLHPGMTEALVSTYDMSRRGRILWKPFVEFLKRVQAGIDPAEFICGRRNKEKSGDDSQEDKGQQMNLASQTCEQMNQDSSGDLEEQDAWIDRFRKLEQALHLSDVKNTGKLEKEKAKRLIHNYNQIYDLCLSPLKIDKAFRPFCTGQEMPLEPLLNYLKEL
ncbi:hypothetical protein JRQ81_014835 [Phrynocephalus forsythii]|uniref:Uncharacterized protein n=1 Tax=Phrynocephalus forsythii TaxID=171643 RepID=A0A9Q1B3W3_9SAUR|nr:hypothetical protein JRQ81_014835 [Phrynocephalus forsythii]